MTKVTLYIAASNDGFIADKDGGVDFLPELSLEIDYGYTEFYESIDVIVMGSNSFRQIISFRNWPFSNKKNYILTKDNSVNIQADVEFSNQRPRDLLDEMPDNSHVWLLGGSKLSKSFDEENLIDDIILTIFPVNLTEGVLLEVNLQKYQFIKTLNFKDGARQDIYRRN